MGKCNFSTSLICCDLASISEDLDQIIEHEGFNYLHADFMDGHFVPRYGISPELVQALRRRYGSRVSIDAHMMVDDPFTYADTIAPYVDWYTLHYEAVTDPVRTIQKIRREWPSVQVGVAFNLFTPNGAICEVVESGLVDGVMLMGISPGVLGTSSFPSIINDRIRMISSCAEDVSLFIDGSVNYKTIPQYMQDGANLDELTLVCGSSSILKRDDVTKDMSRRDMISWNIDRINEAYGKK